MKSLTHWLFLTTLSSSLVLSNIAYAEEANTDDDKAAKTEASATEKPEESTAEKTTETVTKESEKETEENDKKETDDTKSAETKDDKTDDTKSTETKDDKTDEAKSSETKDDKADDTKSTETENDKTDDKTESSTEAVKEDDKTGKTDKADQNETKDDKTDDTKSTETENDKTDDKTESSTEAVKEDDKTEKTDNESDTNKADQTKTSTETNTEASNAKPDLEREKRLADEIVDAILDGEAVMLKDGDHEFLGIYTEADKAKGTVIILHGRGFHPDWMDTIQPLRVGLVEEGWSTLSLQMPVLEKSAKYYDYYPIFPASFPRIESAIKYINEQNDKPVMLLAHSCGAHMAMAWIHDKGEAVNEAIAGYIGLGMGATDYKQKMKQAFSLPNLTVPVLDVYGENDYSAVLRMAPERLAMIEKAGNEQSKQMSIPKADHYYTDKGDALSKAIGEWLNDLTFK